ncbi:MAG: type II and III secretion system protein [Verrucomicrobiota bacterium]|nr:type II and III secretion system protein [Verrucomicrobiota bacterium]
MTKPPVAHTLASLFGLTALGLTLAPIPVALAGERSTTTGYRVTSTASSVVERERVRRADYESRGRAAIEAGDRAMREKDYETAVAQYKLATDLIPNAPNTRRLHEKALDGFCDASVKLAEQRITEGRYADAENLLKRVLSEAYNPRHKPSVVLLSRLETPGYFNRTITPRFRGNVEEVKKLLLEADGYYESGRYDQAFKRCEQVLNIDPYNIAARKMEEKINLARDHYAVAAYNEARSRAIWLTDEAWANPVRKFGLRAGEVIIQDRTDAAGTARIQAKLDRIIIPRLEFKDATIREAVEFLKKKSVELDTTEPDPTQKGVNIVLKLDAPQGMGLPPPEMVPPAPLPGAIPGLEPAPGVPPAAPAAPAPPPVPSGDARITVSLTNIPLVEALKYVTSLANLKFKVDAYAVSIVPLGTITEVLLTKEYKVPPGFISRAAEGGGAPAGDALAAAGGTTTDVTRGGTGISARRDAKDFLMASGVTFPPGATATYFSVSSRLVVRNTQENLDLIDTLVAMEGQGGPAQVEIEAKFVEITQANQKELSFDWLLGQSNFPRQGSVFLGGGTPGTGPGVNPADFGFVAPGGEAVGQFPVTAGNRTGNLAISANAIDALLFGVQGSSAVAPGIFSIAGAFTDPQFQVVIRALNQKKGVDLLSAPKVTTKSGQRAVIEIIREFRYPTEFDPPQIPQNFGQNQGGFSIIQDPLNPLQQQNAGSFPVTPTTPTAFETRNTGVTLEVEPQVGPDGYTIDLQLVPQVVEFEGFINYGSPIQTSSTNALGQSVTNVITPNVINQPIFSTRKVTTSVTIFDGQTVLLGGLIREDVQKVEDKVPFLGDIPLVGRLFRSSVDQHIKRNLVIFVSARLINPAGEAVRLEEEEEEVVETLPMPEAQAPLPDLPLMPK